MRIELGRVSKFLHQAGYEYEVLDGATVVCQGWAGGDALTAREQAKEHARRALQKRERARLASLTGDVD